MAVRVVCALLVLLASASAAAEPGFVWDAPATCPDSAEVRHRIEQRLESDITVRGIEVSITRERTGFVAHIDTRAVTVANQMRTLTSARCDELADAVAVIVARLASEAHHQRVAAAAEQDGQVRAAMQETITGPVRKKPLSWGNGPSVEQGVVAAASPGKWGGGMRALALSGIGMVPRVGVGAEIGGFVRRHDAFGEIGYARWADQPMFLVDGAPGRVDVGLQAITIRGGWASERMPLRGWLGVELGSLHGTGVAIADPRFGSGRWTAFTSGFGVAWPMSRYSRLVGTFEVAVPIQRVRFALAESNDEVYQPAAASARCALGLEVGWR
jgi:hypothetical protein